MILFSAHMEQVGEISERDARAAMRRGDAEPVWERASKRERVLVGIRRAFGQTVINSPRGITIGEVEAAMSGAAKPALKLKLWPVTGHLAYRHAQAVE